MRVAHVLASMGLPAALCSTLWACQSDLPVREYEELRPRGIISGKVLYQGPAPCTENGHVLGDMVLLVFHSNALPPPDGLSGSTANFTTVSGDVLFADLRSQLPVHADGSRACPDPSATASVTASADFIVSPIDGGAYQIRAFYDRDGDFFPVFSYSNLPTRGDVAGGSLENPGEFLTGQRPRYRNIQLGVRDSQGKYQIPETGAKLENVSVVVGRPYELQRPYYYYGEVIDEWYGNQDPSHVVMPADYWANDFSGLNIEKSLLRIKLFAGVPQAEAQAASQKPFGFHLTDPGQLMVYAYDFNGDGVVDRNDHVPESSLVPALMPMVVWTKTALPNLTASDPRRLARQSSPTVIFLGLTMAKDSILQSISFHETTPQPFDHVMVAVRPAAICIDSSTSPPLVTLVSPHEKDRQGGYILGQDTTALKAALAGIVGTTAENTDVIYTCLPKGQYSSNMIYTSGQVWSVPNESGVCMEREAPSAPDSQGLPTVCGERTRLPSQSVVLEVGAPHDDPQACYQFASEQQRLRFRSTCLSPAERDLFDKKQLY